ncbi:tail fiber assembly protein [Vibrio fluvialis]|uniref:tail fiber assembly protein n=1 Tax=Vibrio fluvialis TaxID=676 RepID=UPI001EEBE52C|nr:tail fiber assembly protein [Vibrio fluvialis]EKO3395735.1 hypothetical protein [Vibrio fluvialis]ELH4235754.1 hypothetical protein [Vibrio fluvialis]MCG6400153.1 tail fiber assembly protein [Vibrio fluvialis]
MSIYFSATQLAFFDGDLQAAYESNGLWPNDAIEINTQSHQLIMAELSKGKRLSSDDEGRPMLVDPPLSELDADFARSEHVWVKNELNNVVQVQLMYHWTDDPRATFTEESWKGYARALRNYTSLDVSGCPIMKQAERPERPM